MSINARLRYEVLRRDGFACRYCGSKAPDVELEVDHVLPVALGGGDEAGNLVAACAGCNAGKASSSPDAPIVDAVADDALRWAAAIREAARMQVAEQASRDAYASAFLTAWREHWVAEARCSCEKMCLPRDWRATLDHIHDAGLDEVIMASAVVATMARENVPGERLFRYFCGICWRRVDQLQETAREIIQGGA